MPGESFLNFFTFSRQWLDIYVVKCCSLCLYVGGCKRILLKQFNSLLIYRRLLVIMYIPEWPFSLYN